MIALWKLASESTAALPRRHEGATEQRNEGVSMTSMERWLDDNVVLRYGNFINGNWEDAGRSPTAIRNPARKDQILGYFASSSAADVDRAVSAADHAWKSWLNVPGPVAGQILSKGPDYLTDGEKIFALAPTPEQVKVLPSSLVKVALAVGDFGFLSGEI